MRVTSITELRKSLPSEFNHVMDDHETLVITKNNQSAVMISLQEYNALVETAYLLGNVNNAKHLAKSISQLDNKQTLENKLLDE